MQMSAQIDGLIADLRIAAGDDDAASPVVERLMRALELSLRVHLLDLIGEAAAELTAQLPAGRVDVRLAGPDPSLVFVTDQTNGGSGDGDDQTARITLRMSDRLKASAEAAAGREGLSVNAWLVKAVRSALGRRTAGNRLQGFARS